MATRETSGDTGVGLAILLSLLSVGGAFLMYLSPDDPLAGWGFALAILAASLAVAAVHLY